MSKDTEAIRPDYRALATEDVPPGTDELVDKIRDEQLADLKDHLGFAQVREALEGRIKDYKEGLFVEAKSSDDFEQIGRKYLVNSIVAAELEGVLAMVDSASSAVKDEEAE